MDVTGAKRHSSSEADNNASNKSPGLSRKVCLLCQDLYVSSLYIVDLNLPDCSVPGSFTIRDPTLRIEHHSSASFGVLGSTLYMVDQIMDYEIHGSDYKEQPNSVYTYDLPLSDDVFNLKLDTSMLMKAPDMNHPKHHPILTPTPDGKKLVVFSCTIHRCLDEYELPRRRRVDFDGKVEFGQTDFELYDPALGSWRELPGIRKLPGILGPEWYADRRIEILMYTFYTHSVFLIRTKFGMFILDLESIDQGWEELDSFYGYKLDKNNGPGACLSVIGDGLCLTDFGLYDLKLLRVSRFPEPSLSPNYNYFPGWDINHINGQNANIQAVSTVLDVCNRECNFCVSIIKKYDCSQYLYMFIDVYRCDVMKYRKEVGDDDGRYEIKGVIPAGTNIVKSFKFVIKDDDEYSPFLLNAFVT